MIRSTSFRARIALRGRSAVADRMGGEWRDNLREARAPFCHVFAISTPPRPFGIACFATAPKDLGCCLRAPNLGRSRQLRRWRNCPPPPSAAGEWHACACHRASPSLTGSQNKIPEGEKPTGIFILAFKNKLARSDWRRCIATLKLLQEKRIELAFANCL